MNRVIIVGGGWAGISCAVHLAPHKAVTLLEAGPHLGGRARQIPFSDMHVDNGQHLLLGAYQQTRALIRLLHKQEVHLFHRQPFEWHMLGPHSRMHLKFSNLPKPWHTLLGFIKAKGLSLKDKGQIAWLLTKLDGMIKQQDISVLESLKKHKQSPKLITQLWGPMCLAALTTPIHIASSHVFAKTLKDALLQSPCDSNYWFAKVDLSELIPEPAKDFIKGYHGEIETHQRATSLILQNNQVIGVKTNKQSYHGQVVLATPFQATQQLLANVPQCDTISRNLAQLKSEPITTIYLQYDASKQLPSPMIGLHGAISQWIFDRRFANQPGLIAVIISGHGPHITMDRHELFQRVTDEIREKWPQFDKAMTYRIIHEKRGAFSACVGSDSLRPAQLTPLKDLYLAGDFTQTPYPSTLEGAVLSGHICAQHILTKDPYETIHQTALSA